MMSVLAPMPNHAWPPTMNTDTTAMMSTMMPELAKLRRMVARMLTVSALRASRSAASNSSRSKSSRPHVFTARMLVTASESTPERRFCACDVRSDSGRILLYITHTNAMYTTIITTRMSTNVGTCHASERMVAAMDVTIGMSEKTTTSTSWLYPLVKRLVWLTSAPPKLLV